MAHQGASCWLAAELHPQALPLPDVGELGRHSFPQGAGEGQVVWRACNKLAVVHPKTPAAVPAQRGVVKKLNGHSPAHVITSWRLQSPQACPLQVSCHLQQADGAHSDSFRGRPSRWTAAMGSAELERKMACHQVLRSLSLGSSCSGGSVKGGGTWQHVLTRYVNSIAPTHSHHPEPAVVVGRAAARCRQSRARPECAGCTHPYAASDVGRAGCE